LKREALAEIATYTPSPPSRGRGLKLRHTDPRSRVAEIAPITGARIETRVAADSWPTTPNRPHHGGAD